MPREAREVPREAREVPREAREVPREAREVPREAHPATTRASRPSFYSPSLAIGGARATSSLEILAGSSFFALASILSSVSS